MLDTTVNIYLDFEQALEINVSTVRELVRDGDRLTIILYNGNVFRLTGPAGEAAEKDIREGMQRMYQEVD